MILHYNYANNRSIILLILIKGTPEHPQPTISLYRISRTLKHLPIMWIRPQLYLLIPYPQILSCPLVLYLYTIPITLQPPFSLLCLWHKYQLLYTFLLFYYQCLPQSVIDDFATTIIVLLDKVFCRFCYNRYLRFIQLIQPGIMLDCSLSYRFLSLSLSTIIFYVTI